MPHKKNYHKKRSVFITNSEVIDIMQSSIVIAIKLAAPILILSMAVGILISILQAATQIHEQTITFVPKLLIIAIIMLLTGSWMLESLQDFARSIFSIM